MFRPKTKIRRADHAGSWYSSDSNTLQAELQQYWDDALSKFSEIGQPPIRHARTIISPHAGFRFSGPTAGVAYRALDIQPDTKNIFVIGPSHHVYLTKGTVSTCDQLETPLGNLKVNTDICSELAEDSSLFTTVPKRDEEAEHSLEMQYPWIKFAIDKALGNTSTQTQPQIVPIMVGNTSPSMEKQFGEVLAPYLKDATNLFVISSDFAHWGKRFRYTYYLPQSACDQGSGMNLQNDSQVASNYPIHASISKVDHLTIDAIKTGTYELFKKALDDTGNTVCGRHPIGIIMCALNVLHKEFSVSESFSGFVFTDYTRSGLVDDVEDSSVSYASAFAKVQCMDVLAFIKRVYQIQNEPFREFDVNDQKWQGSEFAASAGLADMLATSRDDDNRDGDSISHEASLLKELGSSIPLQSPQMMFLADKARNIASAEQQGRSDQPAHGVTERSQNKQHSSFDRRQDEEPQLWNWSDSRGGDRREKSRELKAFRRSNKY